MPLGLMLLSHRHLGTPQPPLHIPWNRYVSSPHKVGLCASWGCLLPSQGHLSFQRDTEGNLVLTCHLPWPLGQLQPALLRGGWEGFGHPWQHFSREARTQVWTRSWALASFGLVQSREYWKPQKWFSGIDNRASGGQEGFC